jgi:hypothetical protein
MNPAEGSSRGHARRMSKSPTKKDDIQEEPKVTDGLLEGDSKSSSDEVGLDNMSDDGLQDDEETGLTGKAKGRRKNKRRRNTLLDQRIAGDVKITAEEKKEADQNVVRKSVINGILIGLWYLFSLSISIVSLPGLQASLVSNQYAVQQMDVLERPPRFPFPLIYDLHTYARPVLFIVTGSVLLTSIPPTL